MKREKGRNTTGRKDGIHAKEGLRAIIAITLTIIVVIIVLGVKAYEVIDTLKLDSEVDYSKYDKKVIAEKSDLLNRYMLDIGTYSPKDINIADCYYSAILESANDPYTVYYDKKEFMEIKKEIDSEFYGVGITYTYDKEYGTNEIISVYANSPAEEAGIKKGDSIYSINGKYVFDKSTDAISDSIRGELGSTRDIVLVRGDSKITVKIKLRKLELVSVESENIAKDIKLIRISEFNKYTNEELKRVLKSLSSEDKIILDLRDNGGGVITEAVDVLNNFLGKEIVAVTKEKKDNKITEYKTKKGKIDNEMVVLINRNTASASEIVASALRDFNRAKLVGELTYGKGIMQSIIELGDGTGIRITIGKWFSSKDVCIHDIGVSPDIEVKNVDKVESEDDIDELDEQLEMALGVLEK